MSRIIESGTPDASQFVARSRGAFQSEKAAMRKAIALSAPIVLHVPESRLSAAAWYVGSLVLAQ